VSAGLVTGLIGLGAGAIALWIDVRFPRLAPQEMAKAMLHVGASFAVGYAVGPAFQALVSYGDPRLTLLAIFALGFPAVVYCLLAGIWVIKFTQRMLSGNLR
jgi:uncharacterized membrane protein